MTEHKKIIEAALFISSKPLDLNDLAKITGLNSLGYLKDVIKELEEEYSNRGMEILKTPEGWEMQVRRELLERVSHLTPHSDLSEGCKRSLALIVYKEPLKQSELKKIQGNKAYSYIKELIKRGLVKAEKRGHTKILSVTPQFERYFGEEKKKIKELMESQKTAAEEASKETSSGSSEE
jgi:segregation and condensation protein B